MTLTTKELKSIQLIAEQLISYGLQKSVPIFTSTSKLKQLVPYYESGAIEITSKVSKQIILGEEVDVILHHYKNDVSVCHDKLYSLIPNQCIISHYDNNDYIVLIESSESKYKNTFVDMDNDYISVTILSGPPALDMAFNATMPNSYEALKQLSYLVHTDLYSTLNS